MLKPKPNTNFDAIACAKQVIEREIEGLSAVAAAFDATFVAAVECVAALKGRLIISGMGKSGHVARKIAATLASTGTPAYFVHPSEASHGDLGMVTTDDALLLLSNSGETAELGDLIHYAKRFHIPLIGLARRGSSMLIEAADYAFVLPEVPEASPVGAPTTSTTMMMAWGDALAMALLEVRGFTKEDFGVLHPGGKLGQALLRVEALMHSGDAVPLVAPDTPMQEVLLTMTTKRFGCAGVVEKNQLIGLITDGDLRRHMNPQLLEKSARDLMTANPRTIRPASLAAEALGVMNSKSITSLFVVDEARKPIGILHIHDCLRAGIQ